MKNTMKNTMKNIVNNIWKKIKKKITVSKKVLIWLILSYLIPIINIILVAIVNNVCSINGIMNRNVISIILATNTCFLVNILGTIYVNRKERELTFWTNVVFFAINLSLFAFIIFEIERHISIVNTNIYNIVNVITIIVSILCAFIVKEDELDEYEQFAQDSKNITTIQVGDKNLNM